MAKMNQFIDEIVENLKLADPYRIMLFGSYGTEQFDDESDLDLVVIMDIETFPESYDDKLRLKVMVRNCILENSKEYPIDLVVYTKPEFDAIRELQTSFYIELSTKGHVLYEKANKKLA